MKSYEGINSEVGNDYKPEPYITKEVLKKKLSESIVEVTFTKKNGDVRKMNCTLSKEHLPEKDFSKPLMEQGNDKDDNLIAVWDTDKKGWRSFNIDSIMLVV